MIRMALPRFDDKQFLIAGVFLGGFLICVTVALFDLVFTGASEALKLIGTLFGGWVGTIIGFYFGQKPVAQARAELEEERKRNEELVDYVKTRFDETEERRKELVSELIKKNKNKEP
jgi:hypothetical protein